MTPLDATRSGALDRPEISDLVVAYDPTTLARLDVRRDEAIAELERHRMRWAARHLATWPHARGVLDASAVDAILLAAHLELQRLSEEFRQGDRVRSLLAPMLSALRASGVKPPYRVVDVGCGLGYVVRWLAAHGDLGRDVRLVGCDYNARFVETATRFAREEKLDCEFAVANAFRLAEPATIFVSTGVVHHFRGGALDAFLAEQRESGAVAYLHSDTKPSWLAPLGSFIFHRARMRVPLARHDGVLSALRAHSSDALTGAARRAMKAPSRESFLHATFDGAPELFPILRVMQMFVGVRATLAEAFVDALGPLAGRLGALA